MPIKIKRFKKKPRVNRKKKMFAPTSVAVQSANRALLVNSAKLSPFAQHHTANFRYCQQIAISCGLTCGVWSFRLNSMFDPDYTGGGHQPLFRDVMSGIYARYRVNYVDYKITILDNTYPMLMGALATQDSGFNPATQQFQSMIEKRNTKWIPCLVSNEAKTLSGRVYNHRVAGVTKKAYQDERSYSAAVGSDPTLPLFLSVFLQEVSSNSRTINIMVEMDLNTTYYEPVVQPQN